MPTLSQIFVLVVVILAMFKPSLNIYGNVEKGHWHVY